MKKKGILIICMISILLFTGCNKKEQNNDNTITTNKTGTFFFVSSFSDVLLSYGNEIFDKKEYLNYKTGDNEYYISLANLKESFFPISNPKLSHISFVNSSAELQAKILMFSILIPLSKNSNSFCIFHSSFLLSCHILQHFYCNIRFISFQPKLLIILFFY